MSYTGSEDTAQRKPDWRTFAACLGLGDTMFPDSNTKGIEHAKAVCRSCPVVDDCLQFALDEGIPAGIFGGLTEVERAGLRRSTHRHSLSAEDAAKKAAKAREPKKPRTLRSIFDDNTKPLEGGHLAWTGADKTHFHGRVYTPKQVAFITDRGHYAEGRVNAVCGVSECVLPAHLTDQEERGGWCGTRTGYTRHRKNGEEACGPCRQANTDADNRLRRTGTSKVAV